MIHTTSQKQQRAKQFRVQETLPEWPAYLRAVPDTETRQRVAGAITVVEDWLELRPSTAARLEMRAQLCRIRRLAESLSAS